jgi:CheY-like chemotaxis protein
MFGNLFKSKKKHINVTILIVDDSEIDRKLIFKALENEGYRLIQAENGELGLQAALKENPDLIFLDCQMPVMDGLTMCRKLKESIRTKTIPVVFLTALDTPRNIIDCFEVDAENYLSKPISPKILVNQVKLILQETKLKV